MKRKLLAFLMTMMTVSALGGCGTEAGDTKAQEEKSSEYEYGRNECREKD